MENRPVNCTINMVDTHTVNGKKMATGYDESKPLLETRVAVRLTRDALHQRHDGIQRLSGAAERLRDATRLQAVLAQANREKMKMKAKPSRFNLFKRDKKKKKKESADEPPVQVGSVQSHDSELGGQYAIDESDSDEERQSISISNDNITQQIEHVKQKESILRRLYDGEMLSHDDIVREAVDMGMNIDNLAQDMFQRADELNRATVFEKNPPVHVESARNKSKMIAIGVGIAVAVIIIAVIIVLAIRPWNK